MNQDKLGFGIIGCGVISTAHLGGIASCPEAELVAVCDIDEEKGRKCATDNGNVAFYKDYLEMVKDPKVDVVCICTPSGLHADGVIAAAKAGKQVFCEKPLDISYERMCRMIEAVDQAKVKMGCVFQGRTEQSSISARQAIAAGQLGKMTLGDGFMKYYRSRAYYASAGWRGTWELDGGGALMNQGVHGIDLLMWIMNSPVEQVFARMDHLVREIAVEDTCVASLQFQNGAMGTIIGTTSCNPGEARRVELHGDRGTICLSENKITRFATTSEPDGLATDQKTSEADEKQDSIANNPANFGLHGHSFLIHDLIHAIKENREPYIPGRSARRAVDLILAIYESARSHKDVRVNYGD
ncbi:MAG: Gfo/Idh/MocA family oxidoreductase [Lentisphaeria bacterium]